MIFAASDSRAVSGQMASLGEATDRRLSEPWSHAGGLKAQKTSKGPL